MLPSRALSLCVARGGRRGQTVDLIRFVFTLSPRQEGPRIRSRPAHSDRRERGERGVRYVRGARVIHAV